MKATSSPRATLVNSFNQVYMKELFCIAADDYATAVSPHQRLQIMQRLLFCVGRLSKIMSTFLWVTTFSGSITRT